MTKTDTQLLLTKYSENDRLHIV